MYKKVFLGGKGNLEANEARSFSEASRDMFGKKRTLDGLWARGSCAATVFVPALLTGFDAELASVFAASMCSSECARRSPQSSCCGSLAVSAASTPSSRPRCTDLCSMWLRSEASSGLLPASFISLVVIIDSSSVEKKNLTTEFSLDRL